MKRLLSSGMWPTFSVQPGNHNLPPSQEPDALSYHLSHLTCASSSFPSSLAHSIPTMKHDLVSSTLKINICKQSQTSPTSHMPQEPPSLSPWRQNFSMELSTAHSLCPLTVHLLLGPFQSDSTQSALANAANVTALPR